MKRLLTALIIPAAFVLAWGAGYHFYGHERGAAQAPVSTDVEIERSAENTATDTSAPAETPNAAGRENLAYLGWEVDSSADEPRVCFNFYSSLDDADTIKMRDYVRVAPDISIALEIAGNDLCLTGFAFDQDYTVTLRQGLLDASGKTLNRDIEEAVGFGDKPPFVSFAGQGIILPRVNAQGLAIETINVDAVTVDISRVSDRMIARRAVIGAVISFGGWVSWAFGIWPPKTLEQSM